MGENFVVSSCGSLAAVAYIFAAYFGEFVALPKLAPELDHLPFTIPGLGTLYPLQNLGIKIVAGILLTALTILNVRGVKQGALLQRVSGTAKIVALLGVIGVAFFGGASSGGTTANWFSGPGVLPDALVTGSSWIWVAGITAALSGAFWSYDGWGSVAFIGDEVKEPAKNLPRAIILGSLCFITLYLLINLAYLYVLPVSELGQVPGDRVASALVTRILGPVGGIFIALLVMLSTFDTVNSGILTSGRVHFAMACAGQFPRSVAKIHPRFGTPSRSLWLQLFWSLFLLFSGSFDLVIGMYVFVSWLIYVLMGAGVFILRCRHPERARPFSVPGYPWVPLLFVLFAATFVLFTLIGDVTAFRAGDVPVIRSAVGLVLVFLGLPLYFWLHRKNQAVNV